MMQNTLAKILVDQRHRIEELERRHENRVRTGKIVEVDAAKGLARVQIDTDHKSGKPFLTPWIPWKEPAMGAIKFHTPPAVGEQVKVCSESGDLTDAVIDSSLPSTDNQRPHDKAAEGVITVGNMRMHYKDGLCDISVGGKRIRISADRVDINP